MVTRKRPQTRKQPWLVLVLAMALLFMSMVACNLTSAPPPTVPPRLPTSTPQATIGISTQVPVELPSGIEEGPPTDPGIAALIGQVDSNLLMQHATAMYNVQTRYVNSSQTDPARGIGAARKYIFDTLSSYSAQSQGRLTVWEQQFTVTWEEKETVQHNIVANLQGTEAGAGVIIVGGHYDSVSYDVDASISAPGADDNGTGIAAILELTRILSQTPHRATIIFVLFSAEEIGRYGSIRFIDEYIQAYNIDVRAVLTLDTIGGITGANNEVNDRQIRIFSDDNNNSNARQLSRTIQLIASTYVPELQVVVQPAGDREGRWGDHMSFTAQGYPAVRFIEAIQDPARQNNSFDTIEHIDPTYLTRSTQVALSTVAVMADGMQPPGNFSLRASATDPTASTLIWEPVDGATGYVIALRQPQGITYNQILNVGPTNSLTWSGFSPDRFEALTIATVDESGSYGPFSTEYLLTN